MRTNIDIDDELLAEAMEIMGLSTKKATVEQALRLVVEGRRRRDAVLDMAGLGWDDGLGKYDDLDQFGEGRGRAAAE